MPNLSSIKPFSLFSPCPPCSPWFFCSTKAGVYLLLNRFRGAASARRRGSGSSFSGCRAGGRLRFADPQGGADFGLDPVSHRRVVAERVLRVVAPLPQPLALVREPRAGLVDDLVLDADVDQLAEPRD